MSNLGSISNGAAFELRRIICDAAEAEAATVAFDTYEVAAWLRSKLAEAEKALLAREQMEQSWRKGTNAEWEAAAKMHPTTANEPRMTKADRLRESAAQGRMAAKCLRDVEMFRAVLALAGASRCA